MGGSQGEGSPAPVLHRWDKLVPCPMQYPVPDLFYSPCRRQHGVGLGGAGCPRGASEAEDPWEKFARKMRSSVKGNKTGVTA